MTIFLRTSHKIKNRSDFFLDKMYYFYIIANQNLFAYEVNVY
jgi:hypothetical protein